MLALWVEPGVRVAIFLGTAIPALFVAVVVAGLRHRLDAHVDGLRQLAATDPLTGMLNHGAFGAALERALRAAGEPLTLLLFDIDHFKSVNDRFGHQEGDRMLRLVSDLLVQHKRRDDALGRVGGEEFALLLLRRGRRHARSSSPSASAARCASATALAPAVADAQRRHRRALRIRSRRPMRCWRPPTAPSTSPRTAGATRPCSCAAAA